VGSNSKNSSEKRKLLNFVCSNSTWNDQTLTATFRQLFDYLQLRTQLGKEKRPPELLPAAFHQIMAPHSGQSSQLVVGTRDSNAQFLPTGASCGLMRRCTSTQNCTGCRIVIA
jgi:hypothetical protein